ncbi:hypothetical protein KCU90_g238, partial [Aureobasidium melanogenum]
MLELLGFACIREALLVLEEVVAAFLFDTTRMISALRDLLAQASISAWRLLPDPEIKTRKRAKELAQASQMRCRRNSNNYLRDVHAEESVRVRVAGSRQGALASLVINSSAKSDHIQAVAGVVHLWQHIYRSLFCLAAVLLDASNLLC